jgi:hypothetical protein
MMELEDPSGDINKIEKKMEHLQQMFCETILEEVELGNDVEEDDLQEAIKYFANKEQYEKCIILKKSLINE